MSFDAKRMFELLPPIHRIRDAEGNGSLQALVSLLAEQSDAVQDDLALLYDDLFIETCADWVVPYIGDLIGHRALLGIAGQTATPRAEVANTIGYRRRKGTVAVLGQLTHDVTGWPARVVEFFQIVKTTQYMNHLRPANYQTADLRDWRVVEYLDTAFDTTAHTGEVRRVASGRGRYNLPNIGIFAWRLRPCRVTRGTPRSMVPGGFTFEPLGMDLQLYNPAKNEEELSHLAQPVNVPGPLLRRPLYEELESLRSQSPPPASVWFSDPPAFAVLKNGVAIPFAEVMICDLSQWTLPPAVKLYEGVAMPIQAAVDPVLGRATFPADSLHPEDLIEVDYAYGFSGDYGAGEYARLDLSAPSSAVTEIASSATLPDPVNIVLSPDGAETLQAADGHCPVLDAAVTITAAPNSSLTLDGLLLAHGCRVTGTGPFTLTLRRCTVRPTSGAAPVSIDWSAPGGGTLAIDHSLCGAVEIDAGVALQIAHSLIDCGDSHGQAISQDGTLPAGEITLRYATILGRVAVRETVLVENTILTGIMTSDRTQNGCVRFSFVPPGSVVPRRYECQPDKAISLALTAAQNGNPALTSAQRASIAAKVQSAIQPSFTAVTYGDPAYAQLAQSCPVEIATGADDGSEMGVFHDLFQARRASNLQIRLDEYLRMGLETGLIYVN